MLSSAWPPGRRRLYRLPLCGQIFCKSTHKQAFPGHDEDGYLDDVLERVSRRALLAEPGVRGVAAPASRLAWRSRSTLLYGEAVSARPRGVFVGGSGSKVSCDRRRLSKRITTSGRSLRDIILPVCCFPQLPFTFSEGLTAQPPTFDLLYRTDIDRHCGCASRLRRRQHRG